MIYISQQCRGTFLCFLGGIGFLLFFAVSSQGATIRGKVTSIEERYVQLDVGEDKWVNADDTGKVFYTVTNDAKKKSTCLARIKTSHPSKKSSIAKIEEKPPTQAVKKKPKPGEIWRDPYFGMEFVWVPGGCYEMGCGCWTSDCEDDERPVHTVWVSGFWMGRHEVTNKQFVKFLNDAKGRGPSREPWFEIKDEDSDSHIVGRVGSFRVENGYEYHPLIEVSWYGAVAFARWFSKKTGCKFRLPTEVEWEYACRSGGKKQKYAGGGNVDAVAWYWHNSGKHTHPVATKAHNALGLYDMSGNVWEWCQDWYDENYYRTSPRDNPRGPFGGKYRALRGGSWVSGPRVLGCTNRNWGWPDDRGDTIGFRLVCFIK